MYNDFAETFSASRTDHPWPEIDYIITRIQKMGTVRILDIGCGNGRFLEEAEKQGLTLEHYQGIDTSEKMIEEARRMHPRHAFRVIDMRDLEGLHEVYDGILCIASFHHLETATERMMVLDAFRHLLTPHGVIFMTNWNLREQEKYRDSYQGNGDYEVKIGPYSRYYHGFTVDELDRLFRVNDYTIMENRVFDGGKNIVSILSLEKSENPKV